MVLFSRLLPPLFYACAVDHPDTAAYPKEFVAGARAVALLPQDRWENITVEKIRRLSDKISRSFHSPFSLHHDALTRALNFLQGTGDLTYCQLSPVRSSGSLCFLERSKGRSVQLGG